MTSVILPEHRRWLLRGGAAIILLSVVATWMAAHSDYPSASAPGVQTQKTVPGVTASEIAETARRATVLVVATDRNGDATGQGTGFFISADGLLATNYHVIKGARGLRIQTLDGNPLAQVYLVAMDTTRDLAMLRIERLSGSFLHVASRQTANAGDPVYVMGNPLGQVGTFSTGIVSATRELGSRELIQITAPISPGSSGGPVLNDAGEVIGVATSNLRDGQNMNFAVSARYLTAMMADEANAVPFAQVAAAADIGERQNRESQSRSAAAGTAAAYFAAQIDPQFVVGDSVFRAIGYIPVSGIVRDYLEEGKVNSHQINVDRPGTYVIQAYCDNDCSLLALSIRNASDSVLDTDQGKTDKPMLMFVAESRDRYVMQVLMLSCNISPCAYGARLYRAIQPTAP